MPPSPSKSCKHCHKDKPLSSYYIDRKAKDGRRNICKVCDSIKSEEYRNDPAKREDYLRKAREKVRKFRYQLSPEDLAILEKRHQCCPICKKPFSNEHKAYIDHDHETGKVRALLCNSCNSLLGYSREDEKILHNAIKYLRKHNKWKS